MSLIVALDVDSLGATRDLVEQLKKDVDIFKVGSQLFTACGPAAVRFVEAQGKKVFLDLKFHDIPNTVAEAVSAAVRLSVAVERKKEGLWMYTLHTCGGAEMLRAAVEAGKKTAAEIGVTPPLAIGVTVLTSEAKKDNIRHLTLERARLARDAGLDGVVASCEEAAAIRQEMGPDFLIITPGIRPSGAPTSDQKRVGTPKEAVQAGSNYLVVGRPIIQAEDPAAAAKKILKEIE